MNELELAGPEHLDPAYVAGYERKAGFDPAADVAALQALGLGPERTLVDLGSGTGAFAAAAAAVCGRVVAVDVSPAMLAEARSRVPPSVEVVEAGFLSYEHAGAPADFVYSRNALHHLPDLWKPVALARIARFLRPGGVLFLRDLVFDAEPGELAPVVERWLADAADSSDEGWTREELETHLREEHSTYTWLLEPMLERAGLAVEAAETSRGVYSRFVCRKR